MCIFLLAFAVFWRGDSLLLLMYLYGQRPNPQYGGSGGGYPPHQGLPWEFIGGIYWITFFEYQLNSYLTYLFWYSIWHSIWHNFWHSIWHNFWHSIWKSIWHFVWHLALAIEVWQCPLRSGACGCDPRLPEEKEKEGRRKEKSTLRKSRDPHLAGGEKPPILSPIVFFCTRPLKHSTTWPLLHFFCRCADYVLKMAINP